MGFLAQWKRKCNPLIVSYILDFWAELFEEYLQHKTVVSHGSVISAFHDRIERRKINDNRRVADIMFGIFKQRPRPPRHIFIWNIDAVLQYLRDRPENNVLSGKTVTLKLVLSTGLTSASPASEMSKFELEIFNKVTISLYFLLTQID